MLKFPNKTPAIGIFGAIFALLITFIFISAGNAFAASPIRASMTFGDQSGNYIIAPAGSDVPFAFDLSLDGDVTLETGDEIEIRESVAIFIKIPPLGLNKKEIDFSVATDGNAKLDAKFEFTQIPQKNHDRILKPHPIGTIKIISGSLNRGNHISLFINAPADQVIVVPADMGEQAISFHLKKSGGPKDPIQIADPITVDILGGEARFVRLIAPSDVAVGEKFSLLVKIEDLNGVLSGNYRGMLKFEASGNIPGLPENYSFADSARRYVRIDNLSAKSPGIIRIRAYDAENNLFGESNPIEAVATAPKEKIYWGDLHCHAYDGYELTVLADGTDPRATYKRAHVENGLDFLAITSHVFTDRPDLPAKWWPMVREGAQAAYRPGSFVTFMGYEWRGGAGDHQVIFPGDISGVPSPENNDSWRMYNEAAAAGALVIPHVGGVPGDLKYDDPRVQRLVEVASNHRHNEWYGHKSLDLGNQTGFVGSSDNHIGSCGGDNLIMPGGPPYPRDMKFSNTYNDGGLAAVSAGSLTREGILSALKNRQSYATTGTRIILHADSDGHPMGSEYVSYAHPKLHVRVAASGDIALVEIIRNDSTIHQIAGNGPDMEFSFTDPDPPAGENFYYIRLTQVNEEFAWSSPVWVIQDELKDNKFNPEIKPWNYDRFEDASAIEVSEAIMYSDKVEKALEDIGGYRLIPSLYPYKVVHSIEGDYAVYKSFDPFSSKALRIEYFLDRDYRILRIWPGTLHYGQGE